MLGAILGGASLLGKLFGGAGEGAAKDRLAQNEFLQRENQLQASLYGTQQNALAQLLGLQERGTMDRAQLGIAAPQARMKQALLASLLQNAKPASFSGLPAGVTVPQMSGGLSPALINNLARAGGGELQRQALLALLTKSDVPAQTDYVKQGMLQAPQMARYKQPGKFESFASGAGLIGGLLGGLGQMGVGQRAPVMSNQMGRVAVPADWQLPRSMMG